MAKTVGTKRKQGIALHLLKHMTDDLQQRGYSPRFGIRLGLGTELAVLLSLALHPDPYCNHNPERLLPPTRLPIELQCKPGLTVEFWRGRGFSESEEALIMVRLRVGVGLSEAYRLRPFGLGFGSLLA